MKPSILTDWQRLFELAGILIAAATLVFLILSPLEMSLRLQDVMLYVAGGSGLLVILGLLPKERATLAGGFSVAIVTLVLGVVITFQAIHYRGYQNCMASFTALGLSHKAQVETCRSQVDFAPEVNLWLNGKEYHYPKMVNLN